MGALRSLLCAFLGVGAVVGFGGAAYVNEPARALGDVQPAQGFVVEDARWVYPATYVPEDGLVYCGVAKVASAEWKRALRWMVGMEDWKDAQEDGLLHDKARNGIPHLYDQPVQRIQEILNDDKWVRMIVVREPVERALSGFLQKCGHMWSRGHWLNCPLHIYPKLVPGLDIATNKLACRGQEEAVVKVRTMLGQWASDKPKDAFLAYTTALQRNVNQLVSRGKCAMINPHWRPQQCFCGLGPHGYASAFRIVPMSNMTAEAVAAMEALQLPTPERRREIVEFVQARFEVDQDTGAKQMGASNWTEKSHYFSEAAVEIVRKVYAKDYQLFGKWFER